MSKSILENPDGAKFRKLPREFSDNVLRLEGAEAMLRSAGWRVEDDRTLHFPMVSSLFVFLKSSSLVLDSHLHSLFVSIGPF